MKTAVILAGAAVALAWALTVISTGHPPAHASATLHSPVPASAGLACADIAPALAAFRADGSLTALQGAADRANGTDPVDVAARHLSTDAYAALNGQPAVWAGVRADAAALARLCP